MNPDGLHRFAGRTALVIGASSGIGAAIARRLVAEGANVVAAARRIDLLKAMETELGPTLHGFRCDVLQEADVEQTVAEAARHFAADNPPPALVARLDAERPGP